MTFYVENDTKKEFSFSIEEIFEKVADAVLEMEACPYEVCVNLLLTDNEGIRFYNKEYRNIDKDYDGYMIQIVESDARAFENDCLGKNESMGQILNLIDLD